MDISVDRPNIQSVLCLISLLLKRHKDILDMAQTLILSEMEFVAMTSSIYNILTAFETRFNNLLECWRQQRLDTHLQLSSFAGGMYERWYKELYGDVSSLSRFFILFDKVYSYPGL
jgi:hypothetical protein